MIYRYSLVPNPARFFLIFVRIPKPEGLGRYQVHVQLQHFRLG